MTVRIDVISDVVCPWCFIGKRRLERALALLGEDGREAPEVEVVWHPFQLNPQLPMAGIERSQYIAEKFGARAQDIYGRVSAVGRSVGIDFAFDRIVRQPNTTLAHQLIDVALAQGRQDQMVEALFRGYFLEGADLTQLDSLIELARRAGLDDTVARRKLEDDGQRQTIHTADAQARELGVTGVPFFIFGQKLAVSGAQESDVLARAISEVADEPATHS